MSLGKKLSKFRETYRSTRSSQLSLPGKPSDPYLSYYDTLLTNDDMMALENDWLTDNNIAFWEEYLEREYLPQYPQAKIILLRPTITFLLMKEKDINLVRNALPDFTGITHIFLPVNDQRNVSAAESGSHWSLLLVSVIDRAAFHYDSLGGLNKEDAREATSQLEQVIRTSLYFHNMDDCPQQENMKDCGVFVCILMRHLLLKRLLQANATQKVSMSMANKMIDSHGGRLEMKNIVRHMCQTALERQQYVLLTLKQICKSGLTIVCHSPFCPLDNEELRILTRESPSAWKMRLAAKAANQSIYDENSGSTQNNYTGHGHGSPISLLKDANQVKWRKAPPSYNTLLEQTIISSAKTDDGNQSPTQHGLPFISPVERAE